MKFPEKISLGLSKRMKLVVEAMANIDGKSQQEIIRAGIAAMYNQRSAMIDKEIQHIEHLHKMREDKE